MYVRRYFQGLKIKTNYASRSRNLRSLLVDRFDSRMLKLSALSISWPESRRLCLHTSKIKHRGQKIVLGIIYRIGSAMAPESVLVEWPYMSDVKVEEFPIQFLLDLTFVNQ